MRLGYWRGLIFQPIESPDLASHPASKNDTSLEHAIVVPCRLPCPRTLRRLHIGFSRCTRRTYGGSLSCGSAFFDLERSPHCNLAKKVIAWKRKPSWLSRDEPTRRRSLCPIF